MFSIFERYLKTYGSFTAEELAAIRSVASSRVITKKRQLLSPDVLSRHYTFVCDGCLRIYRIGDNGELHILDFVTANRWATEDYSQLSYNPGVGYVEALSDTQVIQISGEDYKQLVKVIPAFEFLHRKVTVENQMRSIERFYSMVSRSGIERYKDFKSQYPDLYCYLPANMIASYLGLARETFSRIRASER